MSAKIASCDFRQWTKGPPRAKALPSPSAARSKLAVMFTPLAQVILLLAASVFLVTRSRGAWRCRPASRTWSWASSLGPHALARGIGLGRPRACSPSSAWPSCCSPSVWSSPCRACSPCGARCSGSAPPRSSPRRACSRCIAHRRSACAGSSRSWSAAPIAMSSTAILLQQLTERAELNRTHGRLAFAMLLFQDLAFVPLPGARLGADRRRGPLRQRRERCCRCSAACSPSSRCWPPGAGCCGRCSTRSPTAACASCSRSRCCSSCSPRRGYRTAPACRLRSAPSCPA